MGQKDLIDLVYERYGECEDELTKLMYDQVIKSLKLEQGFDRVIEEYLLTLEREKKVAPIDKYFQGKNAGLTFAISELKRQLEVYKHELRAES